MVSHAWTLCLQSEEIDVNCTNYLGFLKNKFLYENMFLFILKIYVNIFNIFYLFSTTIIIILFNWNKKLITEGIIYVERDVAHCATNAC